MSTEITETVTETATVEETMAVAERLARTLRGGDIIELEGDLGTGKTHFVKGLATGLGFPADVVTSPTFTLIDIHRAVASGEGPTLGLVHVDLYRIERVEELAELGLSELPGDGAVAAIEWPERLAERFAHAIRVKLIDLGDDRRRIEIARVE